MTDYVWFCTGCKKKIKASQIQEKEVDLRILPKGVPLIDAFAWLLFKKEHPGISKIKFKHHTDFHKNQRRNCGPLTKITDFEKVVESQIG